MYNEKTYLRQHSGDFLKKKGFNGLGEDQKKRRREAREHGVQQLNRETSQIRRGHTAEVRLHSAQQHATRAAKLAVEKDPKNIGVVTQ